MAANDSLFGYRRRISPFVFSFVPRSQEWYGRAKNTSDFKAVAISAWRANSLPLSNVMPVQATPTAASSRMIPAFTSSDSLVADRPTSV